MYIKRFFTEGEGSRGEDEHEERGLEPTGLVVTLQAFVVLFLWFRLIAYFRGSLAMSQLVHMVQAIIIDIAWVIVDRLAAGVGENHRRCRLGDELVEHFIA